MKRIITCTLLVLLQPLSQATPTNWQHNLKEAEPLDDLKLQEIYPNDPDSGRHLSITITDYVNSFDLQIIQKNRTCHQAYIGDWIVYTTIYIRPATSLHNGLPRFQSIDTFDCQKKSGIFNTFDGSLYREHSRFELRDTLLRAFWSDLYTHITHHCYATKEQARKDVLARIKSFLETVELEDKDEVAFLKEHQFYKDQFKQKFGIACD